MSNSRPIRVAAVDDSADDRARYERRLNVSGLRVFPVIPAEYLAVKSILDAKPDVVLIDYQLNEVQPDGSHPSYLGSTLAAVLREKLPDCPILLVSRRSLIPSGTLNKARDLQTAFDDLFFKDQIFSDPRRFSEELRILVRGYRTLQSRKRNTWKAVLTLLKASAEEGDLLEAADPPLGARAETWRVPEVARWLRHTVLAYPGILYDSLHASAALGLAKPSFTSPLMQKLFSSSQYRGPFAPKEGLWWKDRIVAVAAELLRREHHSNAALSLFGEVWNSLHKPVQKLAICCTSRRSPADSVCYLLKRPVLRRFSLPYHPDNRPSVMDEARVSIKAIRENNDFEEQLVAKEARGLIKAIQSRTK